jgi:hypothetical protein
MDEAERENFRNQMRASNPMTTTPANVSFGPCCFCATPIETIDVDPCRVTVETVEGKWQVWTCHAACFKALIRNPPEAPNLFDPAHLRERSMCGQGRRSAAQDADLTEH